ncbi:MAG TPA: ABC transporter permease [Vicinamibacterales bacterium]
MRRVWLVASREFMSAVANKGFVIGLLIMPAIFAGLFSLMPKLMNRPGEQIRADVRVIDPTGQIFEGLRTALSTEAIARRRQENARRVLDNAPEAVRDVAGDSAETAMERALGTIPVLTVVERPASSDLSQEKSWLTEAGPANAPHRLLVVVHPNAVVPKAGSTDYGTYDLFVPENTDERIETTFYDGFRESALAARVRAQQMDRAQVEAVMRIPRATSTTVGLDTERRTNVRFNRALPFVFAGLLVFGIMIGGQTLLTQTIEEKSSRVVEVLLSAVSPLELMAGKILGQMAVSMLVLALYILIGLALLSSFAMLGLLDPLLIVYLIVFFLVGYLVFASVFAAVGAAVNEMREAQSLMTPIMLALMAPWFFAAPIGRDPNAAFSIAMSLIPPVNTFAMMVRLASSTPPPFWQVALSIAIGLASAVAAMWFAAKVFKVGLLLHGKPPTFGTLIKWAKMA